MRCIYIFQKLKNKSEVFTRGQHDTMVLRLYFYLTRLSLINRKKPTRSLNPNLMEHVHILFFICACNTRMYVLQLNIPFLSTSAKNVKFHFVMNLSHQVSARLALWSFKFCKISTLNYGGQILICHSLSLSLFTNHDFF